MSRGRRKSLGSGEQFGRLTVTGDTKRDRWDNVKFECQCECGGVTWCYSWQLRSGDTVSCGCYRSENVTRINRKTPRRKAK